MATRSLGSDGSSGELYPTISGSDFYVNSQSEASFSEQSRLTVDDDLTDNHCDHQSFLTSLTETHIPASNHTGSRNSTTISKREPLCSQSGVRFEDSPFGSALLNHDVDLAKKLIESATLDTNETFLEGRTALHYACMLGNERIVELLLKAGWRPDRRSKQLRTPLHEAKIAGHPELIPLLAERESEDLNAKDKYGLTATHLAALHGETRCLVELVRMECDTSLEDNCGRLPSHLAASRGHLETIKAMSENGFDIDGEDYEGRLPAHYAAESGSLLCLKFMSSHGIDLVSADSKGWEPIHQASASDQLDCLKFFATHGSKITDKDKQGKNTAHVAAEHGSINCLHWILEQAINPDLKDNKENTLAHLAGLIGSSECINCIVEHKGNMNSKNSESLTPFQIAKYKGKVFKWEQGISGKHCCIYCKEKKEELIRIEQSKSIGIHATIEGATNQMFSIKFVTRDSRGGELRLGKPRMPKGHKVPSRKNEDLNQYRIKRDLAAMFYGPTFY